MEGRDGQTGEQGTTVGSVQPTSAMRGCENSDVDLPVYHENPDSWGFKQNLPISKIIQILKNEMSGLP